jgi:hypothetical protein
MADDDFTRGDALQIAHSCTVDVAGQDHVLDPGSKLFGYGIITGEQEDLVKDDVRTNESIGVPSFNRRIDPNALKDLNRNWTIGKLRDVIFDFSEPLGVSVASAGARRRVAARSAGHSDVVTRESMMMAAAIGAAAGMLVGFLLGRRM